jgi:integrase
MLNSKSKRIRSVPLNDTAIGILSRLDTVGADGYLFINTQTGKPYTTIMKVWSRLRSKAGLPQLRIHDLRAGSRTVIGTPAAQAQPPRRPRVHPKGAGFGVSPEAASGAQPRDASVAGRYKMTLLP